MPRIGILFKLIVLISTFHVHSTHGNSIGVNKKDLEAFNGLREEALTSLDPDVIGHSEMKQLFLNSPVLELQDGRMKREVEFEDESSWFPSLMMKINALTAALKQAFKSNNPPGRKKIKLYENNPYYLPKDAITFDFDREAYKAGKEYDKSGFIKPPHFDLHPSF